MVLYEFSDCSISQKYHGILMGFFLHAINFLIILAPLTFGHDTFLFTCVFFPEVFIVDPFLG